MCVLSVKVTKFSLNFQKEKKIPMELCEYGSCILFVSEGDINAVVTVL